ncbi:unnamed protein product [Peniophora sp. CBMAI 1063]|nr:unnamed protein product [Peniophora sp. CBMAI 1063]
MNDLEPPDALLLYGLGVRFDTRYELKGAPDDMDSAIVMFRRAVELTSKGDPERLLRLLRLGLCLDERFDRTSTIEDLNDGIKTFQPVMELIQDDNPIKPELLFKYGLYFLKRSKRAEKLGDVDGAIKAFSRAVELSADEHPGKSACLANLGTALTIRFRRTGDLDDIGRAISAHSRGLDLTSDNSPERASQLNNLGNAYLVRFRRTGGPEDLTLATVAHHRAIGLMADDHPDKALLFTNLGNSFHKAFEQNGELEDLEKAILAHHRGVDLTHDDHLEKPGQLNALGVSLLTRFEHLSEREDLERGLSAHQRAVDLTPNDHPDKARYLDGLGSSLLVRFERTARLIDLDEAILARRRAVELAQDGHPDKAHRLGNLGNSLNARFAHTGELEALKESISTNHRAVELTPDEHPDKASLLNNLGNSHLEHFQSTGALVDLEQAITVHTRAVQLTSNNMGCVANPVLYSNLGNSFLVRFERMVEPGDLSEAIALHRRAVELTPDGHHDQPSRLQSLGAALLRRFDSESLAEDDDLEQSTLFFRRAIELTADEDPRKPMILGWYCTALCKQYECTGSTATVSDAISAGNLALKLAPERYPNLWLYHHSLAECYLRRFESLECSDDIEKTVRLFSKAADLIADSDPRRSDLLHDLGCAQRLLFRHTNIRTDFNVAVESFLESALHRIGNHRSRLSAAKSCIDMLSECPSFDTVQAPILMIARIITAIVPDIVWLGFNVQRRYKESFHMGALINSAVSVAVSLGALAQAVEWLEAGRALIWAQVSSLRTPLDDLREVSPRLADALQDIQQQLRDSVPSNLAFEAGDILSYAADSAATHHRQLVIQRENLLVEIRALIGFGGFLLPISFEAIAPSLVHLSGPVIFINIHPSRCDALIVHPHGALTSVSLPQLSLKRTEGLLNIWVTQVVGSMGRERGLVPVAPPRGHQDAFTLVLERLWIWVVHPILQSLDLHAMMENDRLPHITWCPTGWLAYLPLHAAGLYNEAFGPRVFDFVVSSYAPSLSALIRSCHKPVHCSGAAPRMLLVTQSATPGQSALPGTIRERENLLQALAPSDIETTILDGGDATVDAVRGALSQQRATWVHLACHGSQDMFADPTQSAFMLHDGRLSLTDLMNTVSDGSAELAFLSACQTAVGALQNPEESAHLAAGMLAVGFKGVVGTTWSIRDDDAPIVVEAFYKKLLALRSDGMLRKGETGAAYALHEATNVLRARVGDDSFMRWVPFVHFGA